MNMPLRIGAAVAVIATAGCCQLQTPQPSAPPRPAAAECVIKEHPLPDLTVLDYRELAERVTGKMLDSALVAGWKDSRPRVVLATVRNLSGDESIPTGEMQQQMAAMLSESAAVRLVDQSATDFDYILRAELSDYVGPAAAGPKAGGYGLEAKLFTIGGEAVGAWSGSVSLEDGLKRCR